MKREIKPLMDYTNPQILKKGERSIYRLVRGRDERYKDQDQMKCIKDEEGKVLATE